MWTLLGLNVEGDRERSGEIRKETRFRRDMTCMNGDQKYKLHIISSDWNKEVCLPYLKQSRTPGLRGEASGQVVLWRKMQVGAPNKWGRDTPVLLGQEPRRTSVEYLESSSKQESSMNELVKPKLAVVCPRWSDKASVRYTKTDAKVIGLSGLHSSWSWQHLGLRLSLVPEAYYPLSMSEEGLFFEVHYRLPHFIPQIIKHTSVMEMKMQLVMN